MNKVYITKTGTFPPGDPVSNDEMEEYLGFINETASKTRRLILRNNKIETRYYALTKEGKPTHTNAQLVHQAITSIFDEQFQETDIELISCGSSTPDITLPSLAAMVHGEFNNVLCEINAAAGCCVAGMNALKFGYLSVKSGEKKNAVCSGSERTSSWMLADKFESEVQHLKELEKQPILAFNKDFLRWMLSDGAGVFLLENKPAEKGISFEIVWMEGYSFAHETEACMYAGSDKAADGSLISWTDIPAEEWLNKSVFAIKQDTKLLGANILVKGARSYKMAMDKHQLTPDDVDYFLPHISSYFFKEGLREEMQKVGMDIPFEKWFMNLNRIGNVGAASIYIMLDELAKSDRLKEGDRILLSVPESGRFSYAYAYLKVVKK